MSSPLSLESVWMDKYRYDDAERSYHEKLSGVSAQPGGSGGDALCGRFERLELENRDLKKTVSDLKELVKGLADRVSVLEGKGKSGAKVEPAAKPQTNGNAKKEESDDDVDLFGSSDEDEAAAELKEKRLKEYAEKKSKKPALIAKSSVILDVKPWDDETSLDEMEKKVRSIEMDGLKWGASKQVPIAYNIKKLQIICVVEDDKVGIEDLSEKIQEFEDFVQSVDVAAFNKI